MNVGERGKEVEKGYSSGILKRNGFGYQTRNKALNAGRRLQWGNLRKSKQNS